MKSISSRSAPPHRDGGEADGDDDEPEAPYKRAPADEVDVRLADEFPHAHSLEPAVTFGDVEDECVQEMAVNTLMSSSSQISVTPKPFTLSGATADYDACNQVRHVRVDDRLARPIEVVANRHA